MLFPFALWPRLRRTMASHPSGLPILMDTFVRLTKSPVVSIAKVRGCVRGVSSEVVLACDMRFASRENTLLGQPEVGMGVNPGGGATERLPLLVGRGRALEIVLGANDFDGDAAERYGYVNRALPDAELDGFVDVLARRIASFDRRPLATAKNLINQVSLPSADRLLDALNAFQTALTWPETQQRIQALSADSSGKATSRIGGPRCSAPPRDVAKIIFTCSWRSCQESSIRCFTPPPVPLLSSPERWVTDRT
jgi:enoyl-CoA hydratase/carnithine racemase